MADSFESTDPFDVEPNFDRGYLPSEEQLSHELDEIEAEHQAKELKRATWLRKYNTSNLPSFRKTPLDPKKKYKVFCLEVLLQSGQLVLFKTIAVDAAECLSHVEEFFHKEIGETMAVKPLFASPPDYPKNLQPLIKGGSV